MSVLNRIARRAVLAAVAASALAAAGAASAEVQMARSECIDGFWHVRTYDITNPNNWVLIEDQATSQPCGEARRAEPARPELNIHYRIEPKYEFRPTLRYSFEEPKAPKSRPHIGLKYKF